MNPVGGLVILLGFILVIIGLNGSQHRVTDAIRNARPSGPRPQAGTGTGGGRATAPTRPPGSVQAPGRPTVPGLPQPPAPGPVI